jgi:RNA 2',3'-cyclic 3'-phosphodiesterase
MTGRGARWHGGPTSRIFFAVPIPAEVRSRVGSLMEAVQGSVGDGHARIRWVRVDGLHLTLRFLGATTDDLLEPLRGVADAVAASRRPFRVVIDGAGAFPDEARPRSLWLGLREGVPELTRLAEAVSSAARAISPHGGADEGRPFAPHLTIARTDGVRLASQAARALEDRATGLDLGFEVDRLALYRSHLGNGPARYEPLREAFLGGTDA